MGLCDRTVDGKKENEPEETKQTAILGKGRRLGCPKFFQGNLKILNVPLEDMQILVKLIQHF